MADGQRARARDAITTAGPEPAGELGAAEASHRARRAEDLAAAAHRVGLAGMRAAGRGPRATAEARGLAMYLARVVGGLTLSGAGRCFGRDRTTVRHACARVARRRGTDRALPHLERALALALARDGADLAPPAPDADAGDAA